MSKYRISEHDFTSVIIDILKRNYGEYAEDIFESSAILGYLNNKTKGANRGSKSRSSFANHYALYVAIEDYIQKGFYDNSNITPYSKYEGARFSDLLTRQRQLPFGSKLQNHALNTRLNDEFKKFYPTEEKAPIVRDVATQRYWIHEDLLLVAIRHKDGKDYVYNIAKVVLEIIGAYISHKQAAFQGFIDTCRKIADLGKQDPKHAVNFVIEQLQPNVDARVFEIVSFAVLKAKYGLDTVWIGDSKETVTEEGLLLYKTGRTNANDGGIDFVMRPLGRFFQVTETIDVSKYFLDIDKVQRFPITFIVKTNESEEKIRSAIEYQAIRKYKINSVVESYMNAIEEIINVDYILKAFNVVIHSNLLQSVMDEIINQSKVEFNYDEDD